MSPGKRYAGPLPGKTERRFDAALIAPVIFDWDGVGVMESAVLLGLLHNCIAGTLS